MRRYNRDDVKNRVKILLECGLSIAEVQNETKVSTRSLYRYRENLRCFGSIDPPCLQKQGHPRALTPEMEEVRSVMVLRGVHC